MVAAADHQSALVKSMAEDRDMAGRELRARTEARGLVGGSTRNEGGRRAVAPVVGESSDVRQQISRIGEIVAVI